MARPAHTPEQIYEAADRLVANGQEPTPGNLREELGGKGSFTTITKHLEVWREQRRSQPAPVVIEMPESVKEAFARCWQAVSVEAGREIAAARQKADAQINELRAMHAESLATIAQVEAEQDAESARADTLAALVESERQLAQVAATDAAAREAGLAATVTELRTQLDVLRTQLQHTHEALHLRVQECARAHSMLDQLREELNLAQNSERKQFEATARAQADVERLTDQLQRQEAVAENVLAEFGRFKQTMNDEVAVLRNEAKTAAVKLGQSEGLVEALRAQVLSQSEVIKGFAPKPTSL